MSTAVQGDLLELLQPVEIRRDLGLVQRHACIAQLIASGRGHWIFNDHAAERCFPHNARKRPCTQKCIAEWAELEARSATNRWGDDRWRTTITKWVNDGDLLP